MHSNSIPSVLQKKILHAGYLILFLLAATGAVSAQQLQVSGSVTNEKNEPLPGVSVSVKGTVTGVLSSADGKYKIATKPTDVLVFSIIGYQTQQVPVSGKTAVDVQLHEQLTQLSDVVVTAMGIKKENKVLGYAITQVKGESFTKARETNIMWGMQGKVAGVSVTKPVTGAMGSSRITMRGGDFGGSQPLYVIDGIPMVSDNRGTINDMYGGSDGGDGISSINPDDVESINVLKGNTAAALYGARASNGVIVITTKKGTARKGIGVEVNSTYSIESAIDKTAKDYQYEYGIGTGGKKPTTAQEALEMGRGSWGAKLDGTPVIQGDGVLRPYSAAKNNVKHFYKNGNTFTNSVALLGGSENLNFRFSFADMNNHDIMPNSGIRRNNFTLNTNARLGKHLTATLNAQYVREKARNRPMLNDYTSNAAVAAYLMPTNYDIRDWRTARKPDGGENLWTTNNYWANPYFVAYETPSYNRDDRFIGSADIKYDFDEHFYARFLTGTDFNYRNAEGVWPSGVGFYPAGSISESNNYRGEFNAQLMAGYNRTFNKDWSLNAFVGGNTMKRKYTSTSANGDKFVVPYFYAIGNTTTNSGGYNRTEKQINSVFGSAELGFHNYFYLTLTGRNDWFSTLNPKDNNIFYPSVGASFVLSDAVKLPEWISFAKIRGSWAQTGSDNDIDAYQLGMTYGFNNSIFGQPLGTVGSSDLPNSKLHPQLTSTYEGGIEARFLNGRAGIDLAVYSRQVTDAILYSNISITSGFYGTRVNAGKIGNTGVELLLTGTPVRTKDFQWQTSYNLGYNKSNVKALSDGATSRQLGQNRSGLWGDGGVPSYTYMQVGQPFGILEGTTYVRDNSGNIVYGADGLPKVGAIRKLGNGIAPTTMGFSNTLTYKNWSLDFLIDGKFGGKLFSGTNNLAWYQGLAKATLPGREGGIVGKGVTEDGKANTVNVSAETYYKFVANNITEEFVYDASFVKLRQVVLGYNLPQRWIKGSAFQSVSLSFVARNLLTIYSKVPVVDPESAYSTGNNQGFEMLGLPATRSFGFNLGVKF
ncbi:SusC/RagA family TonB-linked outer membrane protein [Chitinophaga vietnamensis]|uniref:SusC/RagA family TonB-linked outer membrane protein n=1 Tax=Chitinophaga vietnamensis TaxID=2593957 RepID=UPI001177585D|nr:SusC/RagA family TonB-linked outer membrane protein [Chitinophaga vietnamensis]